MSKPLFTNEEASNAAYRNIRDAKDGPLYSARLRCEYYWQFFERHADNEFLKELRSNFYARYWEMHLTTSLILNGYDVTCPKPGPDVGILYRGQRIWFEAVSPGPGDPGHPDFVAAPKPGEVSDVPNERMVLRYLNSISEKYERQYANWLEKGYISRSDAFVIALNPCLIPFEYADTTPPRILQAAYTVGPQYLTLDKATGEVVGSGFHFRGSIKKTKPKALSADVVDIPTGVFQDRKHNGLSALLCSRVDAVNHRGELDGDYQLVPNPHADVPLPASFRFRGIYYAVVQTGDGYTVTPQGLKLPM
ncbi:hypothetical protein GGD63_006960 [Bradyrhizobium sp. cir1]|uniref:hypothetical protein n=1 Tax=Bradyrhizobium sp. cir1 TaxID=1445730 RepID=UPI0016062BA2|nr:hypothetical protein [Bradyrhizobium sp. cir1]MBB4374131.1 hypothetical protein [Bradyrhizobium sp. cir1]